MKKFPIIELIVKIASRCNLNCSYCYEYNMGDNSWMKASKFMSNETAKLISRRVQEHIDEFSLKEFTIGLHGGEPLLMPANKLDELVQNLKSNINSNINVNIGLQTNGTLVSSEHIEILKKHNIYVSVSLDGTEYIHNKNRVDHQGNASWHKVIKGINLLQEKIPSNMVGILSVIDITSDPIEVFDFLAQFNVDIDLLLPLNTYNNPPLYPSNDYTAYGKWYYKIYKEWINGRNSHIDIRFIKNIITQLLGGQAIYEVMTSSPIGLLTISTDGNIEGLDCLKALGNGMQITNLNLQNNSITSALDHEIVKLRQIGISSLHEKCLNCEYLFGCAGGYFPNRYSDENGFNNPSVYCSDLFWLLKEIENDIKKRIPSNPVLI